jgi:hypothetical protein
MIKQDHVGAGPRHLVRMDLTAAIMFGPVAAIGVFLVSRFMLNFIYEIYYGPLMSEMWARSLWMLLIFHGSVVGVFVFCLPVMGGSAALRYFVLLLHTRRKLPWRLGRFLDACYELGILRVSGTAWQFRHRELQDHLATRPAPPPHS